MNAAKLPVPVKKFGKLIKRKSTVILTGIGITGMVTSTVLAINATPKALALIDIYHEREESGLEPPLTKKKTVQLTWKCYIPAATMGAVSIACLIGANTVNGKQKAALATAYALSESTLHTYQDKIVEILGSEKAIEVQDAVAQEQIARVPIKDKEVIITGNGDHLCFEPVTGRTFRSDAEAIKRSANKLNREMRTSSFITLNDWYCDIGLKPVDSSIGETCGWNIDNGLIDIRFSACVADNGEPCLVINYIVPPSYVYFQY